MCLSQCAGFGTSLCSTQYASCLTTTFASITMLRSPIRPYTSHSWSKRSGS
ncbi:unnamed protein product [Ascophyllum nodosum]